MTDENGRAEIRIQLVTLPDDESFNIQVDYSGSTAYDESFSEQTFDLSRQETSVDFASAIKAKPGADFGLKTILTDNEGRVIPERFVWFTITNVDTNETYEVAFGTNANGEVTINSISNQVLPIGEYTVEATFVEDDYYLGSTGTTTLEIGYWLYLPLISKQSSSQSLCGQTMMPIPGCSGD